MLKIGISGACGKMGRRIISLSKEDKEIKVIFGLENSAHLSVGSVVDGVKIVSDPQAIETCDCLIDFSIVGASLDNLPFLVKFKTAAVIGTTGFSENEQRKIKQAAKVTPIVFSPNMSVGVNLLFKLLKQAAPVLKGYNVYIEEAHHRHKKDAPSGTAKKIAQIINEQGFMVKDEDIKAIREDEIVGDHKVVFESEVDKIELFHSAKTRDIFVQGAVLAAKWIVDKPAGLYSMNDVLFEV